MFHSRAEPQRLEEAMLRFSSLAAIDGWPPTSFSAGGRGPGCGTAADGLVADALRARRHRGGVAAPAPVEEPGAWETVGGGAGLDGMGHDRDQARAQR